MALPLRAGPGDVHPRLGELSRRFPWGAAGRWTAPSMAATIRDTGQPARLDDHSGLGGTIARRVRDLGVRSMCGVPILVDGGIWGGIGVSSEGDELLPVEATDRLAAFTELVAGVISSAATRDRLARLADHRTSLSRIATLAAEESPAAELLAAVMAEATRVLEASAMIVGRYEAGDAMTVVASVNAPRFPVGSRWPLDEPEPVGAGLCHGTAGPNRRLLRAVESVGGGRARLRARSPTIGVPIMVAGRIWGIGCVAMRGTELLPAGAEDRLQRLHRPARHSPSRTRSRAGGRAGWPRNRRRSGGSRPSSPRGPGPPQLFSAVADEVARVLDVAAVSVVRFESDTTSIVVASHNDPGFPVGSRSPLDRPGLSAMVFETGRPARLDDNEGPPGPMAAAARASGASAEVAVPITVDGRVWGMIAVALRSSREARPAHAGILIEPPRAVRRPGARRRAAAWRRSPSWSPPPYQRRRCTMTFAVSPTSRRRCGGWRRSWPTAPHPPPYSTPSPPRPQHSWVPTE